MNTPFTIAIDPGLSGGIVAGSLATPQFVSSMPATEGDVVETIKSLFQVRDQPTVVVIEKLPLFVSVPGGRVSGASMAKLHRNAGLLTGAAMALGIRIEESDPHTWQKHFRLGTKKSAGGYTAWKNVLKGEAQKRFPSIKVTHAIADALLIYEWSRSSRLGA